MAGRGIFFLRGRLQPLVPVFSLETVENGGNGGNGGRFGVARRSETNVLKKNPSANQPKDPAP